MWWPRSFISLLPSEGSVRALLVFSLQGNERTGTANTMFASPSFSFSPHARIYKPVYEISKQVDENVGQANR